MNPGTLGGVLASKNKGIVIADTTRGLGLGKGSQPKTTTKSGTDATTKSGADAITRVKKPATTAADDTREQVQTWFKNLDSSKIEELRKFLQRFFDQMSDRELYEARSQARSETTDYGFMVYYKLAQFCAPFGLPKKVSKVTTKAVQKGADEDATDTIIKAQINAITYLQSSFKFNDGIDPGISIAQKGTVVKFPVALYADDDMKKKKLDQLKVAGDKTEDPLVEFLYPNVIQSEYIPIYHTKGAPWMYAAIQRSLPVHPFNSTDPKVPNLLSLYYAWDRQGMTPEQREDAIEKSRIGQYVKVVANDRGLRDADQTTRDWVYLEIAKNTLNSLLAELKQTKPSK